MTLYLKCDPLPTQMTAAYNSTMTDLKLNKKKQSTGPSFGKHVPLGMDTLEGAIFAWVTGYVLGEGQGGGN